MPCRAPTTCPPLRVETIVTPSPNNFLGLKGVGELPTNGAPAALANAVLDALRPLGVRHLDMPITAHKVWQALVATLRERGWRKTPANSRKDDGSPAQAT